MRMLVEHGLMTSSLHQWEKGCQLCATASSTIKRAAAQP